MVRINKANGVRLVETKTFIDYATWNNFRLAEWPHANHWGVESFVIPEFGDDDYVAEWNESDDSGYVRW